MQPDLVTVQRVFGSVRGHQPTVQCDFVGVQSNLDAVQRDLVTVQNNYSAVYSDFVIVQSVLNTRGWEFGCFVLNLHRFGLISSTISYECLPKR